MDQNLSPKTDRRPQDLTPAGRIIGPDGQPFVIPPEGMLGVLALGAVGLLAWRKSRGKIESSFVKVDPPKDAAEGQGQKKRRAKRRAPDAAPDAAPGKDADGPQAGQ